MIFSSRATLQLYLLFIERAAKAFLSAFAKPALELEQYAAHLSKRAYHAFRQAQCSSVVPGRYHLYHQKVALGSRRETLSVGAEEDAAHLERPVASWWSHRPPEKAGQFCTSERVLQKGDWAVCT